MSLNPDLNPNKSNDKDNWNYTKPEYDDFSTELVGTVVGMQEIQAFKFNANGPTEEGDYWQDGSPKMLIRFIFAMPDGTLKTWTFRPASKAARMGQAKSVHLDLFALTGNTDMKNLLGHTLKITTVKPPDGFGYSKDNPRPWTVELADEAGTFTPAEPVPEQYTKEKLLTADLLRYKHGTPDVTPLPTNTLNPTVQSNNVATSPQMYSEDIPF